MTPLPLNLSNLITTCISLPPLLSPDTYHVFFSIMWWFCAGLIFEFITIIGVSHVLICFLLTPFSCLESWVVLHFFCSLLNPFMQYMNTYTSTHLRSLFPPFFSKLIPSLSPSHVSIHFLSIWSGGVGRYSGAHYGEGSYSSWPGDMESEEERCPPLSPPHPPLFLGFIPMNFFSPFSHYHHICGYLWIMHSSFWHSFQSEVNSTSAIVCMEENNTRWQRRLQL